jgi:hypothetical protein
MRKVLQQKERNKESAAQSSNAPLNFGLARRWLRAAFVNGMR